MAIPGFAGENTKLQMMDSGGRQSGTGTIASTGTTVTGSTTAFDTELVIGDWIYHVNTTTNVVQVRRVNAIASATSLTIDAAFDADLSAGESFSYYEFEDVPEVAEIGGTGAASNFIDVPSVNNATNRTPQIAGNATANPLTFTLNYQPKLSQHALIKTRQNSGLQTAFVIWLGDAKADTGEDWPNPANSAIFVAGDIGGLEVSIAPGDVVTQSVEVSNSIEHLAAGS